MNISSIFPSVLVFFFLFVAVRPAYAVTIPTFPACANPQGSIKVDYSSGTHGIVGNSQEFKGKDKVYTLSDSTLIQCFCPENGDGIQTNWWKATGLSEADIQELKSQGWFFVPNGTLWGLESAPYMAKNSSFSCKSQAGGASGGVGGGSGSVLAAATQNVSGLATTGNLPLIYSFLAFGTGLLTFGLLLKKKL